MAVIAAAYLTLWLRSRIEHPGPAAIAIFAFAAIYIGVGALIGAFVSGPLEGSRLVVLVFVVDVFSGPAMTSAGGRRLRHQGWHPKAPGRSAAAARLRGGSS